MGPASKGIPKEILGKRCKRFGPIQLTWSQPTAILAAMIIQILLSMWRVCSTSPIWFSSEDGSWKKFAKAVFLGRPKASFGFMHITCSSCARWYKYNSDSEFKFSNLVFKPSSTVASLRNSATKWSSCWATQAGDEQRRSFKLRHLPLQDKKGISRLPKAHRFVWHVLHCPTLKSFDLILLIWFLNLTMSLAAANWCQS